MLKHPAGKYRPFPPIDLPDRQWPTRAIRHAPIWMSTDLRDGNQALFEPMDSQRKLQFFHMLCDIGFKEIEVAFPSASQTDFDFVRTLIEDRHIPDDVTIEVLTQAREHLIRRTMESLRGARRAIVHVYNATSPTFRDFVFGLSRAEVIAMAVSAVKLIKDLAEAQPETEWVLEYSPETFTATELDFALEICNAVSATWDARPDRKIILNLPTTVEIATPNIYADQIEWMHRHLDRRDSVILSLHPHNDRGTAVAAAELALMAGADRVEGCLFGNGERTGNVDILTLALNLYTQGVAPGLDFSDIDAIARTYEHCTQLPVAPRHPYAGDLVFTAFSGSHQDAIHKGFARQAAGARWEVPYLPIDPADLGRSYDSIIRINSQSGKGGIAYLMENEFGIRLPRRLQVEFSKIVQAHSDRHGSEVDADTLWSLFSTHYAASTGPFRLTGHQLFQHESGQGIRLMLETPEGIQQLAGTGNGPIDAAIHALRTLGIHAQVRSFEERAMAPSREGGDARACALVELDMASGETSAFGAGIDCNTITASLKALVSAINRLPASRSASAHANAA